LCPSRPGAIAGNLLNFLCLLSASALSATNAGRLQNGTVSTAKLNYFSVCCGKASNWLIDDGAILGVILRDFSPEGSGAHDYRPTRMHISSALDPSQAQDNHYSSGEVQTSAL